VKDKIEAQNEVKVKEQEEKEVVAQQVIIVAILYQHFDCSEGLASINPFLLLFELSSTDMNEICFLLQNMYAQLLPLALPAPPMPGMGGPAGMGGGFAPPPPMGGLGMPPMPPYGMPPMGSSY